MVGIEQVTGYLKNELKLSDSDAAVVQYAMQVLLSSVVNLAAIIATAWLLGVLRYALFAALAAAGLRIISGGAHAAKLFNCSLLGAVISPGIGLTAKYLWPILPDMVLPVIVLVTFVAALVIIRLYAPADTPAKPITKPKQKRSLRILSFLYIVTWAGLAVLTLAKAAPVSEAELLAIAMGILWQVFSLTPVGYRLVKIIDNFLPS